MLDARGQNRTMIGMEKEKMTREQVEAYRTGWSIVKALELEEAKKKSPQERWRELNALYNFAYELGLIHYPSEQELAPIRDRWARLKANYP